MYQNFPSRVLDYAGSIPFIPRVAWVLVKAFRVSYVRRGLAETRSLRQKVSPREEGYKYLHAWIWLFDNAVRAVRLSLDRRKPCRILDLGSGAGYFPVLARVLCHKVQGIDLAEHVIYTPLNRAFGNNILWHKVMATAPVPTTDLEGPFDIITAFSVTFNSHWDGATFQFWTANDWKLFLVGLVPLMRPGGTVFLMLNTKKLMGCLGGEFSVFRSEMIHEAGFECLSVGRRLVQLKLCVQT